MCILLQSSYTCLSPVVVLKLYELNFIIHHVDMSLTFVTARYKNWSFRGQPLTRPTATVTQYISLVQCGFSQRLVPLVL